MPSLLQMFLGIVTLVPSYQDYSFIYETVLKKCPDINPCIVMGVIKTESSLNAVAINDDSIGLMQVRYPTFKWLKCSDDELALFKPVENIECGCKYLLYQLKRYKYNYDYAIASYNSGTVFFRKNGEIVNKSYVDSVMKYKRECDSRPKIQGREK